MNLQEKILEKRPLHLSQIRLFHGLDRGTDQPDIGIHDNGNRDVFQKFPGPPFIQEGMQEGALFKFFPELGGDPSGDEEPSCRQYLESGFFTLDTEFRSSLYSASSFLYLRGKFPPGSFTWIVPPITCLKSRGCSVSRHG